jgi:uncharacterized protein (TIGR00266 family)
MHVTVEGSPAYAIAYCHLAYKETVSIEAGGMALMSDGISTSFNSGGGVIKGLARKALGGESFFLGAYTAEVEGAWVAAAPKFPGDVKALDLAQTGPIMAQSGALLAFDSRVDVSVKAARLASAVATRGLTLLRIHGHGCAVLCSYGAINEFDIAAGQSLVIDTGHLVAYAESMKTELGMLGGAVTSVATGEALVMRIHGPGRVYIQTRAESQLAGWINPMREQN